MGRTLRHDRRMVDDRACVRCGRPDRGIMIAEGAAVRQLLVFLTTVLFATSLLAGMWGSRGVSHTFELRGDRLYVADGRGVSVYDVADPAHVQRLDVEIGDDESHDLAIAGGRLYLATSGGVEWFSVGTDGTLSREGRAENLGFVNRVAARGDYVVAGGGKSIYVLAWEQGELHQLRTYATRSAVRDLTFVKDFVYAGFDGGGVTVYSPEAAGAVAMISIESPTFDVDGETLWIASNQSGLQSFDVRDPASPQFIARVGKNEIHAETVAVANGRAYVMERPDIVRIYDVEDRTAPRLIHVLRDWTHVIDASGNRLFLSGTIIDGEDLPFATGIPVRIYDTTNASAPTILGEFHDLAGALSGVFTDGTLAWVSDPPYFRIIDVSQTDAPRELSSIFIPNIQDHVRVRNGLAILYGRSDVNFIDVTDPYAPKYLGEFESQGHPPSSAAILKDTVVEANGASGLHIIDYSDSAHPVQIAGRIMHYHDLVAGDDAVYTFHQYAWVILDITDRTRVVDRQIRDAVQFLHIDSVPPNSAYPEFLVLSDSDGLQTYSLREDRFDPKFVAKAPLAHPGVFGTSATSAYIERNGTLLRLDMTRPTEFVDTGLRVTSPMQISASGEKVVVADRYSLRVYGPNTAPPPPPPPAPPIRRRASRH